MGYNVTYSGKLKFVIEPNLKQLSKLNSLLENVDLQLLDDYSGLQHNGAEKSNRLYVVINYLIRDMRRTWPEFDLKGTLKARGEDGECWEIVVENAQAKEIS